MTVRAKFKLADVVTHDYGNGYNSHEYVFRAEYDQTIEEDRRFCKATPNGEFRMTVDNPAAREKLKPGAYYYLDLTPVVQ